MITVYYKNESSDGCVIRPTPLVNISQTAIRNGIASLGSEYTITLTGTIIAHEGSPVYSTGGSFGPGGKFAQVGPSWDDTNGASYPDGEIVPYGQKLGSILEKQNVIRELFAQDGQKVEIQSIDENGVKFCCYPVVESVTFDEGIWVDICKYTVVLRASSLLDADGNMLADSKPLGVDGLHKVAGQSDFERSGRMTELEYLEEYGGFVSDFDDSWTIEPDESTRQTDADGRVIPTSYRLSRTMTATGITKYIGDFSGPGDTGEPKMYNAWEQARNFVKKHILKDSGVAGASDYPAYKDIQTYASGFIDIEGFAGYSHSRIENIGQADGTYTITDSWVLASGTTGYEEFNGSVSAAVDAPFIEVTLNGSIRGATSQPAKDQTKPDDIGNTAYDRALQKYYEVSNSGQYGVGSVIYKRANGMVEQVLNSQPKSISLATNEFSGEITYTVVFDNRPTNIFTNVMSESVSVTDTYPGDVFAVIPVIGRATGPVLQYVDTRTEYRRDLSIEINLDYTDIGYGSNRNNLMLTKPSINEPIRSELQTLISQMSPANEPGIRKYFLSAPNENWNPRTGQYSISMSWTYEIDT